MSDFVTLTCPNCGGNLQITNDIDRFSCGHCGKEHMVKRGGGIVSLAPVIQGIKEVQVGVDKTASELAIVRLEKEIKELQEKISDIRSKYSGESYEFKYSLGLIILSVFYFGGAHDNVGLGIIIGIIAVIAWNVGIGILINKNDENTIPLQLEIQKNKQEIEKHKKLVSS